MDQRIELNGPGGVEQFRVVDHVPAEPDPGEIRIRHEAIGVNFIDIYHRTGLYPLPYPAVLGVEGAGHVEAVGAGVTNLVAGDRIAYAGAPVGAYASTRLLPAGRAVLLPGDIPSKIAAASMLRGLTAYMLLTRTYPVGPQTTVLVHAAAGGLGTVLVRWAKHLGASVIGTTSSQDKAQIARGHGADHVIVGRDADIPAQVADLTDGKGVDVAYDGIGGTMLLKTLECVKPFGTIASIGQAGGPIPPLAVEALGPRRALTLARPSVMAYSADPAIYPVATAALMSIMQEGIVATVGHEYPLADVASAHADLEQSRTTGSLLLIPE